MKHILLCVISLFTFITSWSQISVKGKVSDNHGMPVAFAFITIMKNDSTQQSIAQKITDTLGDFRLEIKEKGTFIIRATSVGYSETKDTLLVNGADMKVDLVMQKSENNLSDVKVMARQPLIERKIDRMVMNVENNPLTAGKSSMEAIALAPGIFIYNGQISLNGNSNTRIMVNGKLLQLSGQDLINYLNSLRSDEIKSIEIMAHPPAEYDAAGTGGIINIVLKKQIHAGLNGSVFGNYMQGKYAGTSEGAQINFKEGKVGLFADYSYDDERSFHNLEQERSFPNSGIYTASNHAINNYSSNRIHTGATYDITGNQYLAVDYTGSFSSNKEHWSSISQINYPQNSENNNSSKGLFPNIYKGNYNDAGLDYHIKTDSLGSGFTFLSDYTHNTNNVSNNVTSSNYDAENKFIGDTAYQNRTPSSANIFTVDAKYIKAFNAVSSLSFGAKLSSTNIHNLANFEYLDNNMIWQNSGAQNFIYDYKENIVAGYINYSGNIFKTDLQIGLRGENTNYTGLLTDSVGMNKNKKNYFGLFPSVFLKRTLNKAGDESLAFNYSRRLSRPDFDNLNPHITYIDNYTTGQGNPYLQPEYDNSYQLDYTFKSKYTISASYSDNKDVINNAIKPDSINAEKMIQQQINSGSTRTWMLSAAIPVNITKWWTTQEYIQLYHQRSLAEQYDIKKNLVLISTTQEFTIAENFTASLHANYLNHIIFANAVISHIFETDIAIQKKFFKQRLTAKASLDDVFHTANLHGEFYYNDFNLTFSEQQQHQKITLGLTYNFDLGKTFKSHKIESSNEDEKSRL
ncbi:MAG TPA: outer membrane beta-barrel protein [Arachidicoccus sp.]